MRAFMLAGAPTSIRKRIQLNSGHAPVLVSQFLLTPCSVWHSVLLFGTISGWSSEPSQCEFRTYQPKEYLRPVKDATNNPHKPGESPRMIRRLIEQILEGQKRRDNAV